MEVAYRDHCGYIDTCVICEALGWPDQKVVYWAKCWVDYHCPDGHDFDGPVDVPLCGRHVDEWTFEIRSGAATIRKLGLSIVFQYGAQRVTAEIRNTSCSCRCNAAQLFLHITLGEGWWNMKTWKDPDCDHDVLDLKSFLNDSNRRSQASLDGVVRYSVSLGVCPNRYHVMKSHRWDPLPVVDYNRPPYSPDLDLTDHPSVGVDVGLVIYHPLCGMGFHLVEEGGCLLLGVEKSAYRPAFPSPEETTAIFPIHR